jgi:hypothetical protein
MDEIIKFLYLFSSVAVTVVEVFACLLVWDPEVLDFEGSPALGNRTNVRLIGAICFVGSVIAGALLYHFCPTSIVEEMYWQFK